MAVILLEDQLLQAMPAGRWTRARSRICGISTWLMRPLATSYWKLIMAGLERRCVLRDSTLLIVVENSRRRRPYRLRNPIPLCPTWQVGPTLALHLLRL